MLKENWRQPMPLSREELARLKNDLAELRLTETDHALERDSVIFTIEQFVGCDVQTVQGYPELVNSGEIPQEERLAIPSDNKKIIFGDLTVNSLTVKRVKEIIESHIKGFEYNNEVLGGNDFCYKYGAQALKHLLKEISEAENDTRTET